MADHEEHERFCTGANDSIRLFRAVGRNELVDIQQFGGFRQRPDGWSYEAKLFATSAEDAANFGFINQQLSGRPFTIVEARVPLSFVNNLGGVSPMECHL